MNIKEAIDFTAALFQKEKVGERELDHELLLLTKDGFCSWGLGDEILRVPSEMHKIVQTTRYIAKQKDLRVVTLAARNFIVPHELTKRLGKNAIDRIISKRDFKKYPEIINALFISAEDRIGNKGTKVLQINLDKKGKMISLSEMENKQLQESLEKSNVPEFYFFSEVEPEVMAHPQVVAMMDGLMEGILETMVAYDDTMAMVESLEKDEKDKIIIDPPSLLQ